MILRSQHPFDATASAAFSDLLSRGDLPEDGWRLSNLLRRIEADTARLVQMAEHPQAGRFAFKFQLRPAQAEAFGERYDVLAGLDRIFPRSDSLGLQRPVALDRERQASLTSYAEGKPLSEAMRAADRVGQLRLLKHAGRWLDAFHRCGIEERRVFRPSYTLQYYRTLRTRILEGEERPAARKLFLRGIDKLEAIAPDYENRNTVSAIQHGDFHMRNLVFDGQCLTGIDITKAAPAPVGYDIAKILLDFTTLLRSPEGLDAGQLLPDDVQRAFFAGYRLTGPEDPSVGFLLHARLLATMAQIPQDRQARSLARQRRLRRLRPFAEHLFG